MHIEIEIKDVYGNKTFYPVCEKSKLFASIAGTITLTQGTLALIEQLGYDVKVVTVPKGWREV